MEAKGFWSEENENKLLAKIEAKVKEESDKYLSMPEADIEEIFKYTFQEMTPNLKEQLEEFINIREGKPVTPIETEEQEESQLDVEIDQVKPE